MTINMEGIREAAIVAAHRQVRVLRKNYTRTSILAPLHDLFYCLEQSPDDLELAKAAAKGMIETERGVSDPARYHAWWEVVDLLYDEVITRDPLYCLKRQHEICSAYIIFYRQALLDVFIEASTRTKREKAQKQEGHDLL